MSLSRQSRWLSGQDRRDGAERIGCGWAWRAGTALSPLADSQAQRGVGVARGNRTPQGCPGRSRAITLPPFGPVRQIYLDSNHQLPLEGL